MMDLDDLTKWTVVYLKGFAMGSADAVPGVSGGTIALIMNIYERLIEAVTSIRLVKVVSIIKSAFKLDIEAIDAEIRSMDGYFTAVLLMGVLTALVSVLRMMHYLLEFHTIITYGFFFGLIGASVIILRNKVQLDNKWSSIAAFSGFSLAFLTSGYAATSLGNGILITFFSGVVAASAMILPGTSGSLMLIILGQYNYLSSTLTEFTNSIIKSLTSGDLGLVVEASPPIVAFLSGAFIGLFTLAHSIRRALENYKEITMAFLISLVAGALRAPVVEVEKVLVDTQGSWSTVLPEFTTAAIAGVVLILVVDHKAGLV